MRYIFLVLIGISILSGIGHTKERLGLAHRPLPSPDGEHLVLISEWRYNKTQEYTLTIFTRKHYDYYRTIYSLTPRIKEVILAPDGETIAYLAQDFFHWMGIYFWKAGTALGITYGETGVKMEQIQFSKDQQYLRYYTKPSTGGLSGKWVAMSLKDGKYIFSKKEQEKIEWSPIEKPKEIPPFLTQPVPKIHSQTQIQWSPNSKSLYVLDETGIWRSDIDKPFICQWIEIVKTPSILQFQLSPKGTHLLYEVMSIDEEEREIWISNVDSTSSHQIAKGWSAIFSHDGRFVFYGNLSGFYQFDLDSMRARKLRPATYRP